MLHTAVVPQDWLLIHPENQRDAQVIGSHPDCSVQVRVRLPLLQADHAVIVAGVVTNVCRPFHSTTSDLPMIRSSMTDCSNQAYHAVIRIALILVFTGISGEDI